MDSYIFEYNVETLSLPPAEREFTKVLIIFFFIKKKHFYFGNNTIS